MFAHRGKTFKRLLGFAAAVSLLGLAVLAGCGSSDSEPERGGRESSPAAGPPATAASAEIEDADPADMEVIGAWVEALTAGDVEAAADLFAVPSVAQNGPVQIRIRDHQDAVAFNESLPCGGRIVAAETSGTKTIATFELSERPGGGCGSGTGATARTSFVVEGGKIVEWWRLTDPPQPPGIEADTI